MTVIPSIVWVALPLGLVAATIGLQVLRGRAPGRRGLRVAISLLLGGYLLATAGLGVFWVARQQLPVFDLHYLFGYAMTVLAVVHVALNFRGLVRYFRRSRRSGAQAATPATKDGALSGRGEAAGAKVGTRSGRTRAMLLRGVAVAVGVTMAFILGMRQGQRGALQWGEAEGGGGASSATGGLAARIGSRGPTGVVEKYHEHSCLSRLGVFARAPHVDWGAKPAVFKTYTGQPQLPLGSPFLPVMAGRCLSEALVGAAPRAAVPAEAGPEAKPTRAAVSALLHHTAGITEERGGHALRAAPSSGALFPTEVYLALRQGSGPVAGLFHYGPDGHGLTQLGDDMPPPAAWGVAATAVDARAPLLVALTSVFRRVAHKYGHRAYRYTMADAGHALENLRIAASEIGLNLRLVDRFDESLAAQTLGVDGVEEGPVALAWLLPAGAVPLRRPSASGAFGAYQYPPAPTAPSGSLGVVGFVHAATSLRWTPDGGEAPARPDAAASSGTAAVALPAPAPAPGSALATIAVRRSQRRFTDQPLPLETLASLLYDAAAPGPSLSAAVRLSVVVQRVAGLEPGVYRYQPQDHTLTLHRPGQLRGEAQEAAMGQELVGDAAAVVVLSADRQQILRADGARGYRHALIESGMVSERFALGAVAWGLGACPVGAFYDDDAAELVGVSLAQEWPLLMVPLGAL